MENDNQTSIIRNILSLGLNPDAVVWEYFREGIEISPIYESEAGCSAAFIRYAPGSSVPMHEHTGYEHILILKGAQQVDDSEYGTGDLMISPPGSSHQIQSKSGCIVLAIWEKPVKFINKEG